MKQRPPTTSLSGVDWRLDDDGQMAAFGPDGTRALWSPMPGSQEAYLRSPVFEVLYEGTRGPGKTDALLFDFQQHTGKLSYNNGMQWSGFGPDWSGVILRQTFPQLSDIISKSKKWFNRLHPDVRPVFHETKTTWTWPTGETLWFTHMKTPDEYYRFHGHSYTFVGWEELTTWPDLQCYLLMMSTCRSARANVPLKYRATTNPYGPGHNAVKRRFRLPTAPLRPGQRARMTPIIREPGEPDRIAIHGYLHENIVMLAADPRYEERLAQAARNPAERAAWIDGSWDIVAGGMFDDVWDARYHVVPNLFLHQLPRGWRVRRSYDHGQSKPFSVGWHAVSNGEPVMTRSGPVGTVPGDVIRVHEWYGSHMDNVGVRMEARAIARGIRDREHDWGVWGLVRTGPADDAVFDNFEGERSVAGEMEKEGVTWAPAGKGPGSRRQGWEMFRTYLANAKPSSTGPREHPGYFVCERCTDFMRTVPVLPRSTRDPDDVDTEAEDHIGDEVRYMLRHSASQAISRSWT